MEFLKMGAEALWFTFYEFFIGPNALPPLQIILGISVISSVAGIIARAISRNRRPEPTVIIIREQNGQQNPWDLS